MPKTATDFAIRHHFRLRKDRRGYALVNARGELIGAHELERIVLAGADNQARRKRAAAQLQGTIKLFGQ